MRLVDMTDKQLLEQMAHIGGFDKALNNVWLERHDMNIPYYMEGREELLIINASTDTVVPDEACDKLILEQAEEIRYRRRTDKLPKPFLQGTLHNSDREPVLYRHYKGRLYQFYTQAYDSETLELVVVYGDVIKGTVWTRPKEEFYGYTINKRTNEDVRRFKRTADKKQ